MQAYTCNRIILCLVQLNSVRVVARADFGIVSDTPKYVKNACVNLGIVYIAITIFGRTHFCKPFLCSNLFNNTSFSLEIFKFLQSGFQAYQ